MDGRVGRVLFAKRIGPLPTKKRSETLVRADAYRISSGFARQNTCGHDAGYDFVRLYWEQGSEDIWLAQNITDVAAALPV